MTREMVFSCTHQPFHFANYSFYATRMHSTLFYFPVIGREQLKLKEKISGWGRRYACVSLTDGPQLSPSALHTGAAAVAPAPPCRRRVSRGWWVTCSSPTWGRFVISSPVPLLSSLNHTNTSLHRGFLRAPFLLLSTFLYNGWWDVCCD